MPKKQKIKFKKPERFVAEIFHHHTASASRSYDFEAIKKDHEALRYHDGKGIHYHFLIDPDGVLHYGRDLEHKPLAQANHNTGTISICLMGLGDSFTEAQFETLRRLDKKINKAYKGKVRFRSHKDVNATECPHFSLANIIEIDSKGFMPYKKPWWKKLFGLGLKVGIAQGLG